MPEFEAHIQERLMTDGMKSETKLTQKVSDYNRKEIWLHTSRPFVSKSFLTSAERTEILGRFRNNVRSKQHHYATGRGIADRHIEKNFWVRHL